MAPPKPHNHCVTSAAGWTDCQEGASTSALFRFDFTVISNANLNPNPIASVLVHFYIHPPREYYVQPLGFTTLSKRLPRD
uniref:Uncharacterized protein n=1 Tax=Panagrellus redivivus TaxID=6233 RepID=A0A7E4UR75_PANRE